MSTQQGHNGGKRVWILRKTVILGASGVTWTRHWHYGIITMGWIWNDNM
jgi:hypothetical protein